jgi:hypothetical protein
MTMDQALPPFASTGWGLAVGSTMAWPVLALGLVLTGLAVVKRRPGLATLLAVSVFSCPVFAGLLWISINWLGYGGGEAEGAVALFVDRAAMVVAAASLVVIIGAGAFFLIRLVASGRGRLAI